LSAPQRNLEDTLSIAASICWEWCRQTGDQLAVAVAGNEPWVLSGCTSRGFAVSVLQRMATEEGCRAPDLDRLLPGLTEIRIPSAPVLLLSTRPASFHSELALALRQQVAFLDVSEQSEIDFFERAAHEPTNALSRQ
jgi:hypothetical protein